MEWTRLFGHTVTIYEKRLGHPVSDLPDITGKISEILPQKCPCLLHVSYEKISHVFL